MSPSAPVAVSVTRTIAAPADAVYAAVSDITRMPQYSPETVATRWLGDADGPEVGARFEGRNRIGRVRWSTRPTIVEATPGERFAFRVPGRSGATWTYEFVELDGATSVTESVHQEHRSPWPIRFLQRRAGVTDRATHLAEGMVTTLERLAQAVEHEHRSTIPTR